MAGGTAFKMENSIKSKAPEALSCFTGLPLYIQKKKKRVLTWLTPLPAAVLEELGHLDSTWQSLPNNLLEKISSQETQRIKFLILVKEHSPSNQTNIVKYLESIYS